MSSYLLPAMTAVGLLLCSSALANPDDAQPEFASRIGAMKCSQFTAILAKGGLDEQLSWSVVTAWAEGYLAAWNNIRMNMNKNPLDMYSEAFPQSAQREYIAKYCEANPSDQIIDATLNMIGLWQKIEQ